MSDFGISNSRETSWVVVRTTKWLGILIMRKKKILDNSTCYSLTPHMGNCAFVNGFLGFAIYDLPIEAQLNENNFSENGHFG